MKQFTIYCTQEQTIRAYKLGAQLDNVQKDLFNRPAVCIPYLSMSAIMEGIEEGVLPEDTSLRDFDEFFAIPTAEQMCGWLRGKGIHIQIMIYGHKSFYCALYKIGCFDDAQRLSDVFDNYEQATLAAIDAALDYLEGNTNQ